MCTTSWSFLPSDSPPLPENPIHVPVCREHSLRVVGRPHLHQARGLLEQLLEPADVAIPRGVRAAGDVQQALRLERRVPLHAPELMPLAAVLHQKRGCQTLLKKSHFEKQGKGFCFGEVLTDGKGADATVCLVQKILGLSG